MSFRVCRYFPSLAALAALATLASLAALCGACASPHMAGPPAADATPLHDAAAPTVDAAGASSDATAATDSAVPVDASVPVPDGAPACGAVGQPCCSGVCGASSYCYMSACIARPTIEVLGPDGNVLGVQCSDLSRAHVNPGYFTRVIIHGRANGISYRYYKKTSCGNTAAQLVPDGMQPLDGSGNYVYTIENAVGDPSCTNGNIGVYEEWAVVDGVESVHAFGRVFASGCAMYSTCGAVSGACP